MAQDDEKQLEQLLKENSKYFEKTEQGKIRCKINGHEFVAKHSILAPFIQGKKFMTIKKRFDAENNLEKYEPFIVQSKNFPNMLFCALTGQLMDKSVASVKTHMKGKKFQRNKDLFVADKKELMPEPDIDTLMAEIMNRKVSTKKAEDGDDAADEGEDVVEGDEGEGDEAEEDEDEMPEDDGDDVDVEGMDDDNDDEVEANKAGKQASIGKKRSRDSKPAAANGVQLVNKKSTASEKKAAGNKTQQKQHSRNGGQQELEMVNGDDKKAAGDEEEPEFWVPEEFADIEKVATASDEEGDGDVDMDGDAAAVDAGGDDDVEDKQEVAAKGKKAQGKAAAKGKQQQPQKPAGKKQAGQGKQPLKAGKGKAAAVAAEGSTEPQQRRQSQRKKSEQQVKAKDDQEEKRDSDFEFSGGEEDAAKPAAKAAPKKRNVNRQKAKKAKAA